MSQQLNLFDDFSLYEGVDVEYKAALGGLPRDIWSTYSAFANTEGGTIWLGISQASGRLEIHGVGDADSLLKDLWSTVNNPEKVSCNLLSNDDVETHRIKDSEKRVISVRVPRAGRRERPVFVGRDAFRGTYRRNYEGDYRCTDAEVRRMFSDQSDESADSRVLPDFGMDDLHPESIKQFRNRMASRDPSHPWLLEDDSGLLEKLGGWRRNRKTGKAELTRAGLLFFGKQLSIQDPDAVPGFQLDYRERFSEDPNIRWTDRLTLDGTWEGNLFQFYQRVMQKLSIGPGVKLPFQRDEEGYRQTVTPVHEALQEALVNALIHADYSGQGGIVIDRYLDRFEFSNPGTLLLSREQLLKGGVSECRNKSLQLMFQMIGISDKAGSGIDKIRKGWASQHWQSPHLKETTRPDRVILSLPMESLLPEGVLAELEQRYGQRFAALDKDEVLTLVTVAQEGGVSNQRLQEVLPMHSRDITFLLQGLVRKEFLVPEGFGRWTQYGLREPDSAHRADSSHQTGGSSHQIGPDSHQIGPDSHHSGASAGQAAGLGLPPTAAEFPALWAMAAPVRESPKAPAAEVRALLLRVCADGYLTLRQLADLLGRDAGNLRQRYVSELVSQARLELLYPDKPNHPQQGYRTKQA